MRADSVDDPAEPGYSTESRRIRVLWLIKGLGRGGAEMLLFHAARLRDRKRFDCELGYLLEDRGWLAGDLREQGVPVHLFASKGSTDLRWALALRRHLMRNPVDVVHVHSPVVSAVARLVVRSLPAAVRPRCLSTEHLPWSGHARLTRLMNAATFGLDDAHLAVSSAVVDSIPKRLRRNIRVLVHGIPVEETRSQKTARDAVRAELGVAPDEVLVGTVANVTKQKAYPDLLRAARLVLDRGAKVRFAVAGRGTLDREIRALRDEMGLGDRLLMLGPLENAPRFIGGCDLFALASHWEGLPLVIMEAMALGVPIVATRVGGVPELVRDGSDGTLVPMARPDLFAQAIFELIEDPSRRALMSKTAAEDALRFDNRTAVRTIEALYLDVVHMPRKERRRR